MDADIENAKNNIRNSTTNSESTGLNNLDLSMNSSSQMNCPLVPNEFHKSSLMENRETPLMDSNQIRAQNITFQSGPLQNLPFQHIQMNHMPMQNMAMPNVPMVPNQPFYMQPNNNRQDNNNKPIVVVVNSNNRMPLSDWKANLICSCFASPTTTACSYFCPCVQYGINKSDVIQGSSCFCGCLTYVLYAILCPCIHPCCIASLREKLRASFNIDGSFCEDCCVHLLCPCCALIQEARELELRKNNSFNNFIQMN
jgi:Cys-rich protein (TIGR01571 family)